ncbi:MAG: SCO family protein, partial [Gammaproteobacteria bacterium]
MKTLRALSLIAAALALVACGNGRQWRTHDITGFMPPLAFHLTGENGQPTTARDFRGHTVLLYFGYTHCPDVCPLTLAALARALHDIGPSADQVRVLFVSVDPERDTPPLLARYTEAFGPRFVGLTGTRQQLDAL